MTSKLRIKKLWCLLVSKNIHINTSWVPPLLSFPTPSTQRWILLIGFGSYKWINPHFMSCSLAGSALKRRRKEGCARWVPYKSLLLEHWGLCSYTTHSFLFSPKLTTKYEMVLDFSQNADYQNAWCYCSVLFATKIQRVFSRWRLPSYENHHSSLHELRRFSLPSLIEKRPNR